MKQLLRPRGVFDGDSLLDRRTVLIEDGVIKVTCEFCNATYRFDPATLTPLPTPH